ncbi:MAG: carbohydrate binding family 9 domain-containing protein [Deltaproteobacteria bacterium]|nr:carbohydrate binding family 9 domain-containing protein [Deltaproteobacteria bacterium]MDQ3300731.1 carbohydrate binding family 9 domain-containing protein [Myxococcota bacterium]
MVDHVHHVVRRCALVVGLIGGLAGSIAITTPASADPLLPAGVRAQAVRRTGAVSIDGDLDEPAWSAAPKQSNFTQRFPKDGSKATLETRFAILYDDHALYVGVWLDDPAPAKIRKLLTRRDVDVNADAVLVGIDSYYDRRTAYVFQLNAAGVQRDMLLYDDSQSDETWDAVWTGNVSVGTTGWTAEFRIPLNQLRFSGADTHQWGLQVVRNVARSQEQSAWSPWPRSGSETVSKFGIVGGIDHVEPGRRLELLPYAIAGLESMPVEDGDPLNDPLTGRGNVGLDLKYGLGPAFTLSATVNPDFGQVEADPSQINLSGNELFFAEKRSFFLEGTDLFRLNIGTNDGGPEGAFYTRRIGAAPPTEPDDYEYIASPTTTTIYGAAKLTGKTRGGWSIGVLDAVTGEETATIIDGMGDRQVSSVAPLTNYSVTRVKRDFREGRTSIGAAATTVHRQLDDARLDSLLHDQAYTAGLIVSHRWAKNAWQLDLRSVGSYVHGSEEAIARTQLSQRHLWQRPDRTDGTFDPTRTSMSGLGTTWKLGRIGDTKHWRYMWAGDVRSAGLELNDAGFQRDSDRLVTFLWGQYHDEAPGDHVLNYQVSADTFLVGGDLAGDPRALAYGFESNANVQLANYWRLGGGINLIDDRWSPGALRGGPSLRADDRVFGFFNVNSDTRKPISINLNMYGSRSPATDSIDGGLDIGAAIQARSNIDVFVGPSFSSRSDSLQYVTETRDAMGQAHYVFARIRQRTAAMTVRMNWTFSPRLSLQAYAQPFIASGRYSDFKDVDDARAKRFDDRFDRLGTTLADGTYTATNNGGTFQFGRPDFDFRQLRSTVVVRWEYRPGSSIFAIWSHGQTSTIDDGRFALGRDLRGLLEAEGEDVVMVKANYWIGL